MVKKKDCVIASVVFYLFMIMMYIYLARGRQKIDVSCWDEPCIRFCCDNSSFCREKNIRESFNKSYIDRYFLEENNDYLILLGRPQCKLMKIDNMDGISFDFDGDLRLDGKYFTINEYCFKESTTAADNSTSWQLRVCERDYYWQETLRIITSIVSSLFIAAIVVAYKSLPEVYSTAAGKCTILLFLSLLIVYITLPLLMAFRMFENFVLLAAFSSFLWSVVVVFDIWWRFKSIRSPENDKNLFKFYCLYCCALLAILGFVLMFDNIRFYGRRSLMNHLVNLLEVVFWGSILFEVVFLLLTGYGIFRMPKYSDAADGLQLSKEKDRYWMYLQFLTISLISWFMFLITRPGRADFWCLVITDVVQCVSAALLFAIFVLTAEMRKLLSQRFSFLEFLNPSD